MNIYDISKKAGVSIATVSRVLNGSAHVSDTTREKVLAVIREANYSPNMHARGLGLHTMKMVGILYSDASDLYLASAVYHLEREFREKGYDSLICCCGYGIERRQKYIDMLLSKKVDAIVLAGSHFVEEYDEDNAYIRAAAQQVPIAVLNGRIVGDNIVCAYCDDRQAMFDMATALFEKGSRQVVFFYGAKSYSARKKVEGLRDAYAQRGLAFREKYAVCCPMPDLSLCAAYLQATRSQFSFDAILCNDDAFAVAAMKYAKREGIQVPQQLRIAGYNDSVLSLCTSPELTSVDNRTRELCIQLVKMTLAALSGAVGQQQYTLPGVLIFRETT